MTGAASVRSSPAIEHWYDLVCPFCYVAQPINLALRAAGAALVARPYEAHPETPLGGRHIGPREGPMYVLLEQEACTAGLTLRWPPRLPNARVALTAMAFFEAHSIDVADILRARLFAAHFARGEDIGDPFCVEHCAQEVGADLIALHEALADGTAAALLGSSERDARRHGVRGTPVWLAGKDLFVGLGGGADLLGRMR